MVLFLKRARLLLHHAQVLFLKANMKIVIENVSDGETIPHNIILIRGRVDNLDSSLLLEEGKN